MSGFIQKRRMVLRVDTAQSLTVAILATLKKTRQPERFIAATAKVAGVTSATKYQRFAPNSIPSMPARRRLHAQYHRPLRRQRHARSPAAGPGPSDAFERPCWGRSIRCAGFRASLRHRVRRRGDHTERTTRLPNPPVRSARGAPTTSEKSRGWKTRPRWIAWPSV
jgi:hypothetical protein